ncbi:hypothetical protein RJJ37_21210 [Rhizobium redzepovicii]|uniref:Uncharacterized protein n=1 Tax=Rhizobium redzepovicii TaxID=2867518 RepID=A0AAW8P545_9HYPH|nr:MULTISPECIES: hypothetical protein [Rhizobium]MDR9762128.1 hypothetical protein [Rhizobium redzepovicii]
MADTPTYLATSAIVSFWASPPLRRLSFGSSSFFTGSAFKTASELGNTTHDKVIAIIAQSILLQECRVPQFADICTKSEKQSIMVSITI